MGHYQEVLDDLRAPTKGMRAAIPEAMSGFGALHAGAMADGAVPTRLKEAAALAISVVKHCEGCIAYHAKAAAEAGATPEEVAEMLGVAVLMEGGPATIYGPKAWAAFEELRVAPPKVAAAS